MPQARRLAKAAGRCQLARMPIVAGVPVKSFAAAKMRLAAAIAADHLFEPFRSLLAGLAFRKKFVGQTPLFYLAIASLVVPSIIVSLGIGVLFQQLGIKPFWAGSGFGAHLTWTLPFGVLNSTERRIIHMTLQKEEDLNTESVGMGRERRLQVSLK